MSSSLALDPAAVVWSVPETDRAAALATRPLLVLMHGRGSHEQDLVTLAPLMSPEFVVASLRAPLPLADAFSWFPIGDPGVPSPVAADAAADSVLDWLDGLPETASIGLLGFSQGGAMSVHLMRRAPERFAAYVNLSGFVIPGEQAADARLEVLRPPVFWGRDEADPVIPALAIDRTVEWLPTHSTLTARLYPDIGHSISPEELYDVNAFLALNLLGRAPGEEPLPV